MIVKREDFEAAVQLLQEAIVEVMESKVGDRRAKLLSELLHNQLRGMELFHQLLLYECDGKFLLDNEGFDLLTKRYRVLLRYFTNFPGVDKKSIYEMLIVGDFYYLLHFHVSEPTS